MHSTITLHPSLDVPTLARIRYPAWLQDLYNKAQLECPTLDLCGSFCLVALDDDWNAHHQHHYYHRYHYHAPRYYHYHSRPAHHHTAQETTRVCKGRRVCTLRVQYERIHSMGTFTPSSPLSHAH